MDGRAQTRPFPDEGIRKLSIAVDVELEDGNGETTVPFAGRVSKAFQSRPTVLLDATTPDGVHIENVDSESLDVVCEGIPRENRREDDDLGMVYRARFVVIGELRRSPRSRRAGRSRL